MTDAKWPGERLELLQKQVCNRFHAEHVQLARGSMIGVSRSILQRPAAVSWPLHGLRHPPRGQGDGWFLWTGDLSEADDFFVPNHVEHVISVWPEVTPYLGLPPGWRVLLAPGYEDVWFDAALLDVSDPL